MKKIIFILCAVILVISFLINGCQKETGCKKCKLNTYVDNKLTVEGDAVEYCDQELKDIEDQEPTIIGSKTTKYECQ